MRGESQSSQMISKVAQLAVRPRHTGSRDLIYDRITLGFDPHKYTSIHSYHYERAHRKRERTELSIPSLREEIVERSTQSSQPLSIVMSSGYEKGSCNKRLNKALPFIQSPSHLPSSCLVSLNLSFIDHIM